MLFAFDYSTSRQFLTNWEFPFFNRRQSRQRTLNSFQQNRTKTISSRILTAAHRYFFHFLRYFKKKMTSNENIDEDAEMKEAPKGAVKTIAPALAAAFKRATKGRWECKACRSFSEDHHKLCAACGEPRNSNVRITVPGKTTTIFSSVVSKKKTSFALIVSNLILIRLAFTSINIFFFIFQASKEDQTISSFTPNTTGSGSLNFSFGSTSNTAKSSTNETPFNFSGSWKKKRI